MISIYAYLDTTIIISKDFGNFDLKNKINNKISGLNKYATSFTKREINHSLLKDAILLHSILVEEMDLSIAYQRLNIYPFTNRRRSRVLYILSKITDRVATRLEDAIVRLETLIIGLHSFLYRDVKLIHSETNCPLIESQIEKKGSVYDINTNCRRDTAICDLDEFLKKNKNKLENIKSQIEIDDKISNLISNILENKYYIAKGRNCFTLSDIIICLDEQNNYPIYSTNIKDFKIICKALNKKFYGIK